MIKTHSMFCWLGRNLFPSMLCNVNWVFKYTTLHACDAFCYEIFNSKKKKPKPVQTDRFRFSFLEQKPVQTGLAQFFQFNLVLA
jgi:hypothetical protein